MHECLKKQFHLPNDDVYSNDFDFHLLVVFISLTGNGLFLIQRNNNCVDHLNDLPVPI